MPESFILDFTHTEVEHGANKPGRASRKPAEHPKEFGTLVFHTECLARLDGNRQTVTLHKTSPEDPNCFVLPKPYKPLKKRRGNKPNVACKEDDTICRPCLSPDNADEDQAMQDESPELGLESSLESADVSALHLTKAPFAPLSFGGELAQPPDTDGLNDLPAAEIANRLSIRGRLLCTTRGKEMVLAINNYVIRVNFGLQGHCFWVSTPIYREITAQSPVNRGLKSKAFSIPEKYQDGPAGNIRQVSIQAAFIRPERTLLFVDHNVMISFHIMAMRKCIVAADLQRESELWPYLWSASHGPDLYLEPDRSLEVLEKWRQHSIMSHNTQAIFLAVKSTQKVFNGYGAQETCDMLAEAFIHPCMPVWQICSNQVLWKHFLDSLFAYRRNRRRILRDNNFPHISLHRPFCMNSNAHERFLAHVLCYKREFVWVDAHMLAGLHRRGLLDPTFVIQPDGTANEIPNTVFYASQCLPNKPPLQIRAGCDRLKLPNYHLAIPAGRTSSKKVHVYTPIIAQPGQDWWPILDIERADQDVKDILNSPTLGPYSFDVFVQGVWSYQKVHDIPVGRRALTAVGNSRRKRPLASDIARTVKQPSCKKFKSLLAAADENVESTELNTRTMRSGRRLARQ